MLSKRYESTKVDCRTLCAIGNHWSTSSDIHLLRLLRCIHHFKSDLINKMDHVRNSGNEKK